MDGVKKILVALAFSDYAEGIFKYASRLAASLDAELVVANIINQRDVNAVETVSTMGYAIDGNQYVKKIKTDRENLIGEYMASSSISSEKTRIIIRVGNPIDELLKTIFAEDIDMVVMGTKGRTDLRHVIVGSVAEQLFRKSPVTVVSYRDETTASDLKGNIQVQRD